MADQKKKDLTQTTDYAFESSSASLKAEPKTTRQTTRHERKPSRHPFSRTKEEPLPQWKIDQQKQFKEWEKAR